MPSRRLAAAAAIVLCVAGQVSAQQAATVTAPLTFHGESGRVPIGACLELKVRTYPDSPWWESSGVAGAAEKSLSAVLAALKAKNRKALLNLSEPPPAKQAKEFEAQIDAYLQQFTVVNVMNIRRAYEFDGLLVFFAVVQATGRTEAPITAPLSFALSATGTAKYLPVRPDTLTFALVQDLASREAGQGASLCSNLKGRFTHRVPLGTPRPGASTASPSSLLLIGGAIGTAGPAGESAAAARAGFEALIKAAAEGLDALVARMAPLGAGRLKTWWATAKDDDRAKFIATIKDATPFFVFDAAPVIVVYTKTASGSVEAIYFLRQGAGLVWTNAYQITVTDRVFKTGPMLEAARQPNPFSKFLLQ